MDFVFFPHKVIFILLFQTGLGLKYMYSLIIRFTFSICVGSIKIKLSWRFNDPK